MFALSKVSNFADYGFPNCYSYSKRQYGNSEIINPTDDEYLDKIKLHLPINEEIYTEMLVCIDPQNKLRKKNSRKSKKPNPTKQTRRSRGRAHARAR